MHSHILMFIQDLAIIMLAAGFTTILCHHLKQPIVLGYILAGIIIGPYTKSFSLISDDVTIKTLAELGVIFLMFSLGLEFNFHRLREVGKTAIIAATIQIVLMTSLGYFIGILFGWEKIDAIFLGAILSISSTMILVKILYELEVSHEEFSQIIFGILIIEDVFAILILTLITGIATAGNMQLFELFVTTIKLLSFLLVSLIAGLFIIPRLLAHVASFNKNEILLVTTLALCFGFCLLVAKLNFSTALGAFVMGAMIAESRQLALIQNLIHSLRDMFSAIFFVSVGLLFDPHVIMQYWLPIFIITVTVMIGKMIGYGAGALISGRSVKTSIRVSMSLAQIGVFSFVIAATGIALHVIGDFMYSIAVGVSMITVFLTPYMIKASGLVVRKLN